MRRRRPKAGNKAEESPRFSTVADGECDFTLKRYAEEGTWGLVGDNAQKSRVS
jgi:catalase